MLFPKNPKTSRLYHLLGLLVCLTDTQQILFSDFILGMAFSSISASRQPTFMERLIQERQVNIAAFSVHLTRHQPRLSEVCIGCYDQSKYIGAIFWNPVVSQTYWSLSLNNIQVAGVNTSPRIVTAVCPGHHDILSFLSTLTSLIQAIDTGTSLIYLPQDLADNLYAQIPGANRAPEYGPGLYTYPCASRPNVSLVFGSQSHAINLQDFNLGMTANSGRCVSLCPYKICGFVARKVY